MGPEGRDSDRARQTREREVMGRIYTAIQGEQPPTRMRSGSGLSGSFGRPLGQKAKKAPPTTPPKALPPSPARQRELSTEEFFPSPQRPPGERRGRHHHALALAQVYNFRRQARPESVKYDFDTMKHRGGAQLEVGPIVHSGAANRRKLPSRSPHKRPASAAPAAQRPSLESLELSPTVSQLSSPGPQPRNATPNGRVRFGAGDQDSPSLAISPVSDGSPYRSSVDVSVSFGASDNVPSCQSPAATEGEETLNFRGRQVRDFEEVMSKAQFMRVKAIFDDLDWEGKGVVSLKSLLEYSRKHNMPLSVFRRVSVGGDGQVSFPELLRCYNHRLRKEEIKQAIHLYTPQLSSDWREKLNDNSTSEIQHIFTRFDVEGKGYLSFEDLVYQLRHNEICTRQELREIFRLADLDPSLPITPQSFEVLLKDYFVHQQKSVGGAPTLDFLTQDKRITTMWSNLFPLSKAPYEFLK